MKIIRGCRVIAWFLLSIALAADINEVPLQVNVAESKINVEVHATGDDFIARLEKFESNINVDKNSGLPTSGILSWDFADLKCGKKGRDKEMLHWLDYEHHPKGSFKMTTLEQESGRTALLGDLTIHGTTKPARVPIVAKVQGGKIEWDGDCLVNYQEFGLEKIVKFAFLKVDPNLKIHFHLSGESTK
jgi:polyisoprenoid-binding protein YceI